MRRWNGKQMKRGEREERRERGEREERERRERGCCFGPGRQITKDGNHRGASDSQPTPRSQDHPSPPRCRVPVQSRARQAQPRRGGSVKDPCRSWHAAAAFASRRGVCGGINQSCAQRRPRGEPSPTGKETLAWLTRRPERYHRGKGARAEAAKEGGAREGRAGLQGCAGARAQMWYAPLH